MLGSKIFAVLITSVMFLGACSTVKLDEGATAEDRTGKAVSQNGSASDAGKADSAANKAKGTATGDPLKDASSILAKRSVYFDLDSYVIKQEYKSLVEAHSKYLIAHPERKIIIQGNTDERGGSEYNLALGQKRAEAVRKAFSLLGVSDKQMEAVSFGKEKPKAQGSNEEAWAENRRSDITY